MPILHLHREIQNLNKLILQLGGQVEENLRQGVQAIQQRNVRKATDIQDEDDLVDSLEVRVEEECLKILALYQPVATDLRYIVAVLKINANLESIGDLTSSLVLHSDAMNRKIQLPIPEQVNTMSALGREMLKSGLNALVERDISLCQSILQREKKMDALYGELHNWFKTEVKQQPDNADIYLNIFMAAKDIERIADHACNIAEDIIYLVTGEIVRHHHLDE